MKARIIGTDAVISVQPLYSEDRLHVEQFVNIANGDLFKPHTIDIISNDTDWDALRNQAAIAAMQGLLCAPSYEADRSKLNMIAEDAISIADTLIEKLKEK